MWPPEISAKGGLEELTKYVDVMYIRRKKAPWEEIEAMEEVSDHYVPRIAKWAEIGTRRAVGELNQRMQEKLHRAEHDYVNERRDKDLETLHPIPRSYNVSAATISEACDLNHVAAEVGWL